MVMRLRAVSSRCINRVQRGTSLSLSHSLSIFRCVSSADLIRHKRVRADDDDDDDELDDVEEARATLNNGGTVAGPKHIHIFPIPSIFLPRI